MDFIIRTGTGYGVPKLLTGSFKELKKESYDKHFFSFEVEKAIKQVNECFTELKKLLEENLSYEEKYKIIMKYYEPVADEEIEEGASFDCVRPQVSIQSGIVEQVVESFKPIYVVKFFLKAHSEINSFFEKTGDDEVKKLVSHARKTVKKSKVYNNYLKWCEYFVNNYWEEIKQVIKVK